MMMRNKRTMARVCNFPMAQGKRCQQLVADNRLDCGRHKAQVSMNLLSVSPATYREYMTEPQAPINAKSRVISQSSAQPAASENEHKSRPRQLLGYPMNHKYKTARVAWHILRDGLSWEEVLPMLIAKASLMLIRKLRARSAAINS